LLKFAHALAFDCVPNLIHRAASCWRRTDAFAKESIPDLVYRALLWHTEAFAELIAPKESWRAHFHPRALAAAGVRIPILVCWAQLPLLTLAFAGLLVPNLVHRADLCLWAHAVTFLEAKVVRWCTFNLLFAYAHALNWIPVKWPNASNSNDFARTWNDDYWTNDCIRNGFIISDFC
jgi:hypothetical protein